MEKGWIKFHKQLLFKQGFQRCLGFQGWEIENTAGREASLGESGKQQKQVCASIKSGLRVNRSKMNIHTQKSDFRLQIVKASQESLDKSIRQVFCIKKASNMPGPHVLSLMHK